MKKTYFLTIATIFLATIIVPTVCMELSSEPSEKHKFTVTLDLKEYKPLPSDKFWNKEDKHNSEVIGMKWEKGNNKYLTQSARLSKSSDPENFYLWNKIHPIGLPLSTKANTSYREEFEYIVTFPSSVSKLWVKKLIEEQSITPTDTLFAEPVEITFVLGSIKSIDGITYTPSNANDQHTIAAYYTKKYLASVSDPSEEDSESFERKNTNKNNSKQQQSSYKTPGYIFTGVTAIGIVAYILYLYQNNQLEAQLSHITDFFNNFISTKNS